MSWINSWRDWLMLAFVFGLGIMADRLYSKLKGISDQLEQLHNMLEKESRGGFGRIAGD